MIGIWHAATAKMVLVVATANDLVGVDLTGMTQITLPDDYDPVTVNYVIVAGAAVRNTAPLIAAIKREAERRILEIAPVWRQINDLYEPVSDGATARRTAINAVRTWSNDQEALVLAGNFAAAWPNGG